MKLKKYIASLSPSRKEMCKLFLKGMTKEQVTLEIAKLRNISPKNLSSFGSLKAHITMAYNELVSKKFNTAPIPVREQIREMLSNGMSVSDTIKAIAKRRGIKSNQRAFGTMKSYVTMEVNKMGGITTKVEVKSKAKEVKKPLDFSEGVCKKRVRNRVVEEVKHSKIKKGLVLTLSWKKCILEKLINKEKELKGLKFLSCECDEKTFDILKDNIKKNKLTFMETPLLSEIGKIIDVAKKDTYAHLFLDYCKSLQQFSSEIEKSLKNKIVVKDGLVWITVTSRVGAGHKGYNTKKEFAKLLERVGKDYKVEFTYAYKDSAPMFTAILRRIK
jgi:hypothetical protein